MARSRSGPKASASLSDHGRLFPPQVDVRPSRLVPSDLMVRHSSFWVTEGCENARAVGRRGHSRIVEGTAGGRAQGPRQFPPQPGAQRRDQNQIGDSRLALRPSTTAEWDSSATANRRGRCPLLERRDERVDDSVGVRVASARRDRDARVGGPHAVRRALSLTKAHRPATNTLRLRRRRVRIPPWHSSSTSQI
jgi:hypothetical protein